MKQRAKKTNEITTPERVKKALKEAEIGTPYFINPVGRSFHLRLQHVKAVYIKKREERIKQIYRSLTEAGISCSCSSEYEDPLITIP